MREWTLERPSVVTEEDMVFNRLSRQERFVLDNSTGLAQHVYYHSARAAKEISETLDGQLPAKAGIDSIAMLLPAARSSIELSAVDRQIGTKAYRALRTALQEMYESMPSDPNRPGFEDVLAITDRVLLEAGEATAAMRAFAAAAFESRDPEDELFHQSLTYGLSVGGTIVDLVKENA